MDTRRCYDCGKKVPVSETSRYSVNTGYSTGRSSRSKRTYYRNVILCKFCKKNREDANFGVVIIGLIVLTGGKIFFPNIAFFQLMFHWLIIPVLIIFCLHLINSVLEKSSK